MKYPVKFNLDFKRNPYKGRFVVLEGIEASGKSTQAKRISEILSKKHKVFLTKNPTDGPIGSFIRKEILADNRAKLNPVSFQYIFAADRVMQQLELIDHLKKGDIVISDRYFWTSVAYGIADREGTDYKNWKEVSVIALSLLSMYHQFLMPDLTIYLDIPLKVSVKRISKSAKHTEIYDNHKMNIKIQKGYNYLLKKFKKEIIILDGTKTEKEITEEILKIINKMKK